MEAERPKPMPRSKGNSIPTPEEIPNNSTNYVTALLEQNKHLDQRLSELDEEEKKKQSRLDDLRREIDGLKERSSLIDEEVKQLDKSHESNRASDEMLHLLSIYDHLKADEKKFKEMCNQELERLQALSLQAEETDSPESEVKDQLERAKARVNAARVELASITRNLNTLKRQIEQVPSRSELGEYRLRFAELYNLVSATHRQTKQFFSLYNSLEDTKSYMEKELSLLNSIVDSYQEACKNPAGRNNFFQQLSSLYEGMKKTCSKVDERFQSEKNSVLKLQLELQRLVDLKVTYEKSLRDLESECKNNDQLLQLCNKKKIKEPPKEPVEVESDDDEDELEYQDPLNP